MSLPFYLDDPRSSWYDETPWHTLDLETTNKDKGDPRNVENRIVVACLDGTVEPDLGMFPELYEPCVLVAHNAKFELGWLWRYRYYMGNFLPFDTMIAEYVLAGNRTADLALDDLARKYGLPSKAPDVDRMMKAGVCPSEMPEAWIRDRVRHDVQVTRRVAEIQYDLLRELGLLPVFFTRCIVTPVLAMMEQQGMALDRDRVAGEYAKQLAVKTAMEGDLALQTGGINMRSRPQLGAFLYDKLGFDELRDRNGEPRRTATGLRLTDADSLAALKAKTPEQRHFLTAQAELASADARLSKSLGVFRAATEKGTRLFANFNQTVTQTHRLSSTAKRIVGPDGKEYGAQFQNMPREYKKLFCGGNDMVLTEIDYSQLEFRVAVDLARDAQGLRDILSGHDVHRFTASVLKKKRAEDVTDEERTAAKSSTFKPLYGGQTGTPAEVAYFKQFRQRYPDIDRMQQRWLASVLRTKELRTASGLVYYWPDTRVTSSGYVTNTASIYNYPVQAFATADIVLIGLTFLHWRLRAARAGRLVNTVHDSVVIEHHPNQTDAVLGAASMALLDDVEHYLGAVYRHSLYVPLECEYVTAKHWADKTEAQFKGSFKMEVETHG